MKKKLAIAIGLIVIGTASPAFSESLNVSYSFNKGNGFSGDGEQINGGKQGYFPLSKDGLFESSGRSGLALSNDVMVVGGLPPQSKNIPMTISLWIKTSIDAAGSVITSKKHSESGQGFSLEFDYDMNVVFDMTDENGGSISIATLTGVPTDNMWHHVAVSYKGDGNANNVGLYIDGVVSELKLISDNLSGDVQTYHPLVIGSGPLYKQAISASIDEFYLLPQAFNDDQVTCLYQLKTDCAYRPTAGTQGARGLMGISGLQGDRGAIGPQGIDGAKGAKGEQGVQGAVGSFGLKGPQGFTGPTGLEGEAGLDGADGTDGKNGANGAVGLQGNVGGQGDRGAKGPTGAVGPQGDTGAKGGQGAIGFKGPKGSTGSQGAKGITGKKGPTGDVGAQGPRGPQGAQGIQGNRGVQGASGPQGTKGPRGFAGSNSKVGLKGLTGPKSTVAGPRGPDGRCWDEFSFSDSEELLQLTKEKSQLSVISSPTKNTRNMASSINSFSKSINEEVKILAHHIGVIDAEFILSKALSIDADGHESIKIDVLGITSQAEMKAYFQAVNLGQELLFIEDIYALKGLDNNYALEVLADYQPALTPFQGVNEE
jgi:hypothetical protein